MARFTYTTSLFIGALVLSACPGDDPTPIDTDGTTAGDDSTGPGPTTTPDPTTTTPDPDSGSSDGGMMCEPECPFGECCVAGSCFNAQPPTCDGGCADNEDCVCPEGVDPCDCAGECVPAECGVDGNYDPCFGVMCPAGYTCLVDNPGNPSVSWCALEGCSDAECDCPPPPEGFEAGCGDLTGSGTNHCSIACGPDSACPEGMICFGGGIACVWPADVKNAQPIYGDCINVEVCEPGLQCIQGASFGWCSPVGCADVMDCEPAPATGDAPVACAPILDMGMQTACILDCSMGQTCPDGMGCFNDQFCVWNEIRPGYGNCGAPGIGCAPAETCLTDMPMGMMDPTWAVCSQPECVDAASCTMLAPATGDAPVACGDPSGMGGTNTCYLDCSMGQTCPDGMACTDGSLCTWSQGAVVFSDDFETGDFSAGWTLEDVDMLMPAMDVAFVDAAWVVDEQEMGNQSAVSTSWYMPAGMSDDWLISPQIMLGPNTRLYWEARSANESFPDGYEVRISTATPVIADFEANMPLMTVAAENPYYTFHSVDLAAAGYADVPVYLAFRNVTNDGLLLLVDDVSVVDVP